MPYNVVMDKTFNPADYGGGVADVLVQAKLLWSIMNGGAVADTVEGHISANTIAHPAFINDGADSHLLFEFADDADLIEVSGAYSTRAVMFADLAPANGTKVNCWDPELAKRGVYMKNGASGTGGWTLDTATPKDKGWNDRNHPQRILELLICCWAYSPTPQSFQGTPFMTGIANGNWTNARLTMDMRVRNVWLGPWGKIPMHIQGSLPIPSAALSESYPEAPNPKYLIANFVKTDQLVSDQLGFGRNSWGQRNVNPVVRDSNRVEVVIDYTPDDSVWECLGDTGRDPTGRLVNYGCGSIADVLADLHGNSYLMAHHDMPVDGVNWWTGNGSLPEVSNFDRLRGTIELYGMKLEQWVP